MNYVARSGPTLTLDSGGEQSTVDLYSQHRFEMLSNLRVKAVVEHRLTYELTCLDRPIIQFPMDMEDSR